MQMRQNYYISPIGTAATQRKWTRTAAECYLRGCVCQGCFFADFFSRRPYKCQMKAAVIELVRLFGTPQKSLLFSTTNDPDYEPDEPENTPWTGSNPDCIFCGNITIKAGFYRGQQQFKCKSCRKSFLAADTGAKND